MKNSKKSNVDQKEEKLTQLIETVTDININAPSLDT